MKLLKKLICAITIVVLALAFAGCGEENDNLQLATPQNVTASDEGLITWDAVDNADYYVVVLNGNSYKCNTTSYQVGSIVNDFTYAVMAVSEHGYKMSAPSKTQTFKGKGIVTPSDPLLDNITVSITGSQFVGSGRTTQLTAIVIYPDGNINKKVDWSVVEGGAYGSVDSSGKFTAKEVTSDHDVTVRATSQENSEKYADLVICVACQPDLTVDMLASIQDDYIGFEGYMDIDLYDFTIFERYVQTVQVPGISTQMNGERWHASYVVETGGYIADIHYRNVDGNAQQIALSLLNDEEYYPMTDSDGNPVSWTEAGLYNNFKSLTIADFEFDEEDWRYYYRGGNSTLVQNMSASANPYEFEADFFGLIIENGEILGLYAQSKPSYNVVDGYKAIQKLYAFINVGEEFVNVPVIQKFEHNPETIGGGNIDHDTLETAIKNMQSLESYKMDYTMSSQMRGTGYSISGYTETVIDGDYFFEPYTINASTSVKTMIEDEQYGYHRISDELYNSYTYFAESDSYVAARSFDGDMNNAKASFAFAPEIFTAWATTVIDGKETSIYYVNESMCHVASTFYYGVGNDMPLYGLFAMYYPNLSPSVPYVVVQDGYIVESYFFYFLADMYGEVVIDYSDFNKAEMPSTFKGELFDSFVPRTPPASWHDLTVIDETLDGNREEVNAYGYLVKLLGSEEEAENLPFFNDILGDTFGLALATYRMVGNKNVETVMLYYDVPLDQDRSINASIKAVQNFLLANGFTKNANGNYVKGNISVLPFDSSLDFLIYVWKTV